MKEVIIEAKSKNPNNLEPIYFSDYFKIDKAKLKELGAFDPIINFDTALFVEPLLLKQSSSEIIANPTNINTLVLDMQELQVLEVARARNLMKKYYFEQKK
jgi:hypothetical protein